MGNLIRERCVNWLGYLFKRPREPRSLMAHEEILPGIGPVRVAYVIDCMGAMCPRPQLLTMKILAMVDAGEVIEVVTDNPAAVETFPSLADTLVCSHLLTIRESDCWRLYLRKEA
ncbi:MAG TPA: sulfurtransferase TusA family protein [Thiobacillaceae bacterium]|nr:sulfurtransferase TusA family protein [Thiobacillaceae bacterium]HNU63998.1 sulfurtransferase TusA family protein [Thiobacillaceae bacterium]